MTLALFLMQMPMDSEIETWEKKGRNGKQVLYGWDVWHAGGSMCRLRSWKVPP